MIEGLIFLAYIVIGIGYAKTFSKLIDDDDFTPFIFAMLLWPVFLVIASFWNFK